MIKLLVVIATLTTTEIPLQTIAPAPAPTCSGVQCLGE